MEKVETGSSSAERTGLVSNCPMRSRFSSGSGMESAARCRQPGRPSASSDDRLPARPSAAAAAPATGAAGDLEPGRLRRRAAGASERSRRHFGLTGRRRSRRIAAACSSFLGAARAAFASRRIAASATGPRRNRTANSPSDRRSRSRRSAGRREPASAGVASSFFCIISLQSFLHPLGETKAARRSLGGG